jgi:hypothetical protein
MILARALATGFFIAATATAVAAQERVAVIEGLELYSAFWPNLHHRLHADARDKMNRIDVSTLPAADRAAWAAALAHYAAGLATRDLRTGRGMTAFSEALSRDGALTASDALSADDIRVLESAAAVYRRHQWPDDDRANRAWIADVAAKLKAISARVLPPLSAFYRLPWYDAANPVRVDIVNVGGARGGYTWRRPRTHTVIDGAEKNYQGWLGVEMLLHEASHGLTDRLAASIEADARAAGKKDDGTLWHVLQFYVVGEVLKRALAADGIAFSPYLYATGLFDRAWKGFRPAVESEASAYLDGGQPLEDALRRIVVATLR